MALRHRYCFALLLGAALALGQMNTGEISGSVRDPSGGVLPGATVLARQPDMAQEFSAVTNSAGEYLFAQLPVGVYTLTVTAPNFKQATLLQLAVHASDQLRRDFTLKLGDRTDVVTIQFEAASAPLESADIRDTIGHDQVIDLPVKGRQFLDLAMLSPLAARAEMRCSRPAPW